ncbi:carboxypeptidase regulatory-like domain-containing protein [Archangium violaceum]|uniref:carboxypeptidase-like regulatory domain-containing protein n=1 Tax=Archangium violaceum TaxID=83451 RepID=UPI0019505ADE|nr:carboxypeptidase-like regulatory domain-containing protein [Archangium violaceum]QRN98425.1 carboxypeptidase regulatory-like domain-containing protein [Archangium violaceum]
MRPMRSLLRLSLLSLGVLSACTLRPYYRQVVPPDVARLKPQQAQGMKDVTMRVVDPSTGQPIPGARVLLDSSRGRVIATSDANGLIQLPVAPHLLADNPLVEVSLPKGVRSYSLQVVNPEPEPAQQPATEPEAPRPPQG